MVFLTESLSVSEEIIVNFKLTPELKKKMDALVASGRYASQSELLRESLRRFLDVEGRKTRPGEAQAVSDLIPGGNRKPKSIEEWISKLHDEWISTKESGAMIAEERAER